MKLAVEKEINFQLSDNIALALACVSCCFIAHFTPAYWGEAILIMEKHGNAFGRVYWYRDDNSTVYLDSLSVDAKVQQQGIGTELQKMREQMGIVLGAKTSCLWVKQDSWMHKWYQRRGYEDWKNYKKENAVWMRKSLVLNGG